MRAEFGSAWPILHGAASAFRAPRRVAVSQGAAASLMIRQPGGYSGPWSADETPYMVEPMDMLASRVHEAVCFVGPSRTGKALDVETPISTPTGWTTMGALQVGDMVLDERGLPTRVVFVTEFQHERACYTVRFSDGEEIVADADHRWGVERSYWRAPHWRYEVRTTVDLLKDLLLKDCGNGRFRYRYRIRNTEPLQLPEADLPLDPYLLGVWLGDGCKGQAAISAHREDASHYVARFEAAGHDVTVSEDGENTVFLTVDRRERLTMHCQRGHVFADVGRAANGGCMECLRLGHWRRKYGHDRDGNAVPPLSMFAHTFSNRLHALGVHGRKHVPSAYLRASAEQRLRLLQGLMDTDGTSDPRQGRAEFTTTLEDLRDGFVELARSLGLRPVVSVKKTSWTYKGERKTGSAFRIGFPVPPGVELFTLPRKASAQRAASVDVGYRQIVSITRAQSRPVKCIQVDSPKHLYLAGRGMVPTHNTMGLLDGWMTHAVCNDPGDMLIIQMSQDKAREYSKTRVDRSIQHSPSLREHMSGSGHDDNTHDKLFRHGMWLKIGWPSASQLSGSDYRYVALTDYDRMPDNIDGEADAFGLGLTRTRTFLSRGMCMVESSPGREVTDPHWRPATAHEAPPCTGVLGIYNRSDRRRWYWPCPHCGEFHQATPGLEIFGTLPPEAELIEIVRSADLDALARMHAQIVCPSCGAVIEASHKHAMNHAGRWLADGQTIDSMGRVDGDGLRSNIAGYWLGGVSAAYQSWHKLVLAYLQGLREYAMTGSELPLQKTCNTDQAMPYLPRHLMADREASVEDRKTEIPRFTVPGWARFLVATADVQGGTNGRFVCEVRAFGPHLESTLVDRFALTTTERSGIAAQVDPSSYPEDWDLLTAKLVTATYRLDDGREMRVLRTAVDTGGEAGTTPNAYAWYRRLRRAGLSSRVMLIKGGSHQQEKPVVKGSARSNAGKPMPDMPVWIINTDYYKDIVAASLRRKVPGPGFFHAPDWLPQSWFDELKAEIRDGKGKWKKVRARNEALDLWVYALAVCEALGFGSKGRLSWDTPPGWALPQSDANSEIIESEERRAEQAAAASAAATSTPESEEDLFAPIPMY